MPVSIHLQSLFCINSTERSAPSIVWWYHPSIFLYKSRFLAKTGMLSKYFSSILKVIFGILWSLNNKNPWRSRFDLWTQHGQLVHHESLPNDRPYLVNCMKRFHNYHLNWNLQKPVRKTGLQALSTPPFSANKELKGWNLDKILTIW